jgi:NADH:ubiquinone reductase (H+-translocating)
VSRTLPVPGLAEHGMGFKTLPEAIALRNRVLGCLEAAETLDDPAERESWLTFVFVGAGYAGLEGLAELQDLAVDAIERYPRCRIQGMRWILVEARDRVMYEISPDLAGFASDELRARGIEIRTSTLVDEVGEDFVRLAPAAEVGPPGETVPARTVAWTTGVRPHPSVAQLGLPLTDTGRIEVDEFMQVTGHPEVWAIGDAAAVPDPARSGQPCPPTCQHAIRQGRTVARNVAAALGTGHRRRFSYKTLGVFVDMGSRKAVAQTVGIKWRGFPAWFLARTYHLAMMPGVGRKLRLLIDWTVGLAFGRDVAEVGQLGHAPRLGEDEVAPAAAGGAMPVGAPSGPPPGPEE